MTGITGLIIHDALTGSLFLPFEETL